jgi:hypothetical protein
VATIEKEIGGRLNHIVIGHFPNSQDVKNMDVVSMEAVVDTDENNVVTAIRNISGIAMASSDKESPAFPGAVRLAQIQAFENVNQEGETLDNSNLLEKEKKMEITFHDIQKAVKEMNVFPHQLFNEDTLRADRVFGKILDERDELKGNNEALKTELEKAQENVKAVGRKAQIVDAKELFNLALEQGNLTSKQKAFIKAKAKIESLEDLSETGVSGYIDSLTNDYAETAKLFGFSENDGDQAQDPSGMEGQSGDPGDLVSSAVDEILGGA